MSRGPLEASGGPLGVSEVTIGPSLLAQLEPLASGASRHMKCLEAQLENLEAHWGVWKPT